MDGIRPHQPNTDINQPFTSVSEQPPFESRLGKELWNDTNDRCISDTFVVNLNTETLFSLSLTTSCEFFLTDHQSNEQINGGYSILDEITTGSVSTIIFFIDGESIGEAVLAWPLEDNLCLIINGVIFRKQNE